MAFSRQVQVLRLLAYYPFESNPPVPLLFVSSITMSTNNMLTLAYITERIWATVFVKSYENQRPLFGAVYAAFIVSFGHIWADSHHLLFA